MIKELLCVFVLTSGKML